MKNLNESLYFLIFILLCVGIVSGQNVKGNFDNEKGEWIQLAKGKFEYKIHEVN
jgi:hypothetical protein